MSIAVSKFGGTSVRSAARINHVANVIADSKSKKQIVVLSAMGDTTDYLLRLAKQCASIPDKRELDLLLSSGEQVSTSLLAIKLRELGINARAFTGQQLGIKTDNFHTNARILDIQKSKLLQILDDCDVVVAAGFQGINQSGDITTLGRGGSDTTAVAIAAALELKSCKVYTDVDGIYTADPRTTSSAQLRKEISYEEASLLAHAGAQVIHPRAVELAQQYDLEIEVLNTFKPNQLGSKIVKEEKMEALSQVYNIAIGQKEACIKLKEISNNFKTIANLAGLIGALDVSIQSASESKAETSDSKSLELYLSYSDEKQLLQAVKALEDATGTTKTDIDLELTNVSIVGRSLSKEVLAKLLETFNHADITPRKVEYSNQKISCLIENFKSILASNLLHEALNNQLSLEDQRAA